MLRRRPPGLNSDEPLLHASSHGGPSMKGRAPRSPGNAIALCAELRVSNDAGIIDSGPGGNTRGSGWALGNRPSDAHPMLDGRLLRRAAASITFDTEGSKSMTDDTARCGDPVGWGRAGEQGVRAKPKRVTPTSKNITPLPDLNI